MNVFWWTIYRTSTRNMETRPFAKRYYTIFIESVKSIIYILCLNSKSKNCSWAVWNTESLFGDVSLFMFFKALALVDEETRRYRPTKNYLEHLPPLELSAFEVIYLWQSIKFFIQCYMFLDSYDENWIWAIVSKETNGCFKHEAVWTATTFSWSFEWSSSMDWMCW